jgi:hypothetical protein
MEGAAASIAIMICAPPPEVGRRNAAVLRPARSQSCLLRRVHGVPVAQAVPERERRSPGVDAGDVAQAAILHISYCRGHGSIASVRGDRVAAAA